MDRRTFIASLVGASAIPIVGCSDTTAPPSWTDFLGEVDPPTPPEVEKTKEQWQAALPPAVYAIMFENGTEPAYSHPLNNEYGAGTYVCFACNNPLFSSDTKYDSKTGWPSFWDRLPGSILYELEIDREQTLPGIEYHCRRCHGHHGHVFGDGPPPTGRRHCNNGLSLKFIPEGDPLPPLVK
ncbi:MAG TPA: peptide-methionine (R)-S-oxide reductase MsrB [Longimicrobiales bacterium]|nr:peptide-methionine (R)-S-oxide reductase MsrB [Longimicrobiales bacterium]